MNLPRVIKIGNTRGRHTKELKREPLFKLNELPKLNTAK